VVREHFYLTPARDVSRGADGTVTFTITAFSRPATALTRSAGPIGRAIQRHMTGRYLRALNAGGTDHERLDA
jgi:uncharacterized protein (UPF0548 family)